MSKEMKHRQKSPTVIARLMGIDSLPVSQSAVTVGENTNDDFSCNTWANKHCGWVEDEHFDNSVPYDHLFSHGKGEYKDIYEVQQKPLVSSVLKTQSTTDETYNDNLCQERMSIVKQKFIEAKRMTSDENPLQSKDFQDAIKFLGSNRDLFLKFFDDSNSQFSENLHEFRKSSLQCQAREITVLKPSIGIIRNVDEDSASKRTDENKGCSGKTNRHCWNSDFSQSKPQRLSQPTKIVVLKPRPQNYHEIKPTDPILSFQNVLCRQRSFGAMHANEAVESPKIAKVITCHTQDESLLSSALSNGYIGDERSCNRLESEFVEEESGSLSDSETATPTSTHSCDHTNELGSPYSSTSFSRTSDSPESFVIIEAKKRLAERLALNVNNPECRVQRTHSGTLAEMLSSSEVKKGEGRNVSSRKMFNAENEIDKHSSFQSMGRERDEFTSMRSHKDLSRSNSAPILLTAYRATGVEVTSLTNKPVVKEEKFNSNTMKSGFKDKVSSFFFSKGKKMNRDDVTSVIPNGSNSDEAWCDEVELVNNNGKNVTTQLLDDRSSQVCLRGALDGPHLRKQRSLKDIIVKLEHHSPVSVLDLPAADDFSNSLFHLSESKMVSNQQTLGRSRPIESVARSLLIDCSYLETPSKPLSISSIFHKADEEHGQFLFVKSLISSARLDTISGTSFARWHSLENPLNPMLLDEYLNMKEAEATCLLPRSQKRLLFDSINAALFDISDGTIKAAYPWGSACARARVNGTMFGLAEEVWRNISNWDSLGKHTPGKSNDIKLLVDRLVKKEASEWKSAECVWSEMYEFCKDIGGKVLEELVEETLSQLL